MNRQLSSLIFNSQHMQFLKQKVKTIFDSKNGSKKKVREELNGRQTLSLLLGKPEEENNSSLYLQLVRLSFGFNQYTEIFNFIITKMGEFSYKSSALKEFLKLLDISCHLVRSGNGEFVNDFKKNEDILLNIQKINTHYYENTYKSNAKQLTYNLELIRHRAIYLKKLVNDSQLLEEEKMITKDRDQIFEDLHKMESGDETINGLKIEGLDKSPIKDLKNVPIQFIMEQQNASQQQTQQRSEFQLKSNNKNLLHSLTGGNKISNIRTS